MGIKDIFVYLFGFLSVISALGVVVSRKSLSSALSLVATMVCIAAQFALMRADFMAMIQILVYAGAIMILVVFVIMLLGVERESEKVSYSIPVYVGLVFSVLFVGILYTLINGSEAITFAHIPAKDLSLVDADNDRAGEVYKIGSYLLHEHLVAFQATGVLLLSAILGAALLSFPKSRALLPGRGLKAVQDKFNTKE